MEQVDPRGRSLNRAVRAAGRRGFTLVEMLVVMGVIAVLLGLIVPAFTSISQGTDLTRGGQDFADALQLARDEALSRNRKVYVCLIQETGSAGAPMHYRGVQTLAVKDDTGATVPVGKALQLPNRIIVSENVNLSALPLLSPPALASPPLPPPSIMVGGVACSYKYFVINANGAPDSSSSGINSANSFLTLLQEKDASATTAPANFFSIYINVYTGEFSTFRP